MKKIFSLTLTLCLAITFVFSQEENKEALPDSLKPWKKSGVGSINFNQVSLNNWAGGGKSSVSGAGLLQLVANYENEDISWNNDLNLAYGMIQQSGSDVVKTDDRIELNSKFGKKANDKWSYSVVFQFRSQFAPGFDDPTSPTRSKISDFLAPGYTFLAIGMDYKPNDKLSIFISPATNKNTIVNNTRLADAGAFGVTPAEYDATTGALLTNGEKFRAEIGGYIKMQYKTEVIENVDFQTKLDLFSNYLNNPTNIDVNWETLLNFKVNKYITANLSTLLIYDDDIKVAVDTDGDDITDKMAVRTQFKEVLSIGFTYKF